MASSQLNDLAVRKQLLIAQADLHRQLLSLESARISAGGFGASAFIDRNRWWLLGGAIVVGAVSARRWRDFAGWLPSLLAAARAFTR